jgi:hypothetical protein
VFDVPKSRPQIDMTAPKKRNVRLHTSLRAI